MAWSIGRVGAGWMWVYSVGTCHGSGDVGGELGFRSKLVASTEARGLSGWPTLGRKRVLRGGEWVSGPLACDGQGGTVGFVCLYSCGARAS
jgi:hypothetical protein